MIIFLYFEDNLVFHVGTNVDPPDTELAAPNNLKVAFCTYWCAIVVGRVIGNSTTWSLGHAIRALESRNRALGNNELMIF